MWVDFVGVYDLRIRILIMGKKNKLNKEQDKWLDNHGGRNENDVCVDKDGYFVWMVDGYGGELKVRIPTFKQVIRSYKQ